MGDFLRLRDLSVCSPFFFFFFNQEVRRRKRKSNHGCWCFISENLLDFGLSLWFDLKNGCVLNYGGSSSKETHVQTEYQSDVNCVHSKSIVRVQFHLASYFTYTPGRRAISIMLLKACVKTWAGALLDSLPTSTLKLWVLTCVIYLAVSPFLTPTSATPTPSPQSTHLKPTQTIDIQSKNAGGLIWVRVAMETFIVKFAIAVAMVTRGNGHRGCLPLELTGF